MKKTKNVCRKAILGKSDLFKDMTGLEGNQEIVKEALKVNAEQLKNTQANAVEGMKIAKQIYDSQQANKDVQRKVEEIDKAFPPDGTDDQKAENDRLKSALFEKQIGIFNEKQSEVNPTPSVNFPENADNVKYKNDKQGLELEYSLPKNVTTEKKQDGTIVTEQITAPPENRDNIEDQGNLVDLIRNNMTDLISEDVSTIKDSDSKNLNT